MSERLWNRLGSALYPRGLWTGPYWWRSLNRCWLAWWGWAFPHSKPWRPGSIENYCRSSFCDCRANDWTEGDWGAEAEAEATPKDSS